MDRKLLYSIPCFLLAACADTSDKYRDTKHLELPPTLAIEHTGGATSASETLATPKQESKPETAPQKTEKPANSELSKLVLIAGSDEKPVLQLKTRFERAWDLVDRGLRLAEIEVIDKNHDQGVYRVRYVANGQGKGRGFVDSITSFFNDKFEDIEYTLTLDKDKKITDVRVEKAVSANQAAGTEKEPSFNNDDSASLVRLLHKTIIADLEK